MLVTGGEVAGGQHRRRSLDRMAVGAADRGGGGDVTAGGRRQYGEPGAGCGNRECPAGGCGMTAKTGSDAARRTRRWATIGHERASRRGQDRPPGTPVTGSVEPSDQLAGNLTGPYLPLTGAT